MKNITEVFKKHDKTFSIDEYYTSIDLTQINIDNLTENEKFEFLLIRDYPQFKAYDGECLFKWDNIPKVTNLDELTIYLKQRLNCFEISIDKKYFFLELIFYLNQEKSRIDAQTLINILKRMIFRTMKQTRKEKNSIDLFKRLICLVEKFKIEENVFIIKIFNLSSKYLDYKENFFYFINFFNFYFGKFKQKNKTYTLMYERFNHFCNKWSIEICENIYEPSQKRFFTVAGIYKLMKNQEGVKKFSRLEIDNCLRFCEKIDDSAMRLQSAVEDITRIAEKNKYKVKECKVKVKEIASYIALNHDKYFAPIQSDGLQKEILKYLALYA